MRPERLAPLFVLLLALLGLTVLFAGSRVSADAPGASAPGTDTEIAIFAGGCFWCMERPFDELEGVLETTSGYTGGHTKRPTYREVSSGSTGHAEAVRVRFDPTKVSYAHLLEVFWHNIDPLTKNAQFCDHGPQYRSAIFTRGANQREAAERSRAQLAASGLLQGSIVTEIVEAGVFTPAEPEHQDYYRKNPIRYRFYRSRCGRDARLEALWGELAGH